MTSSLASSFATAATAATSHGPSCSKSLAISSSLNGLLGSRPPSFGDRNGDAGESPPTPAARREWKPAKLPPPPPPLPVYASSAEVDGTAGATRPRFDEARARRLIEMMEESPEMENPTFVASIRAVIDALVR